MTDSATPMLRQYLDIKKSYPGTLLFFRLGDFYELFNEDAVTGARELGITLTARQKDSPNPIPMCGVPFHAAASYIARLVNKGYRIAICEQTEAAGRGVKLVRREVVRIITPGTAIDLGPMDSKQPSYLAAVACNGDTFGAAFLDVGSGDFSATQHTGPAAWAKVCEQIENYAPAELLFPAALDRIVRQSFGSDTGGLFGGLPEVAVGRPTNIVLTQVEERYFHGPSAVQNLKQHFKVQELTAFELDGKSAAVAAASACLGYVNETQRAAAGHVTSIRYFEATDFLILDACTLRNLEIVKARDGSVARSLLGVVDETHTSMGGRLIRSWLLRPSIRRSEVETRLAAVDELADSILREKIRALLKPVADLEKLAGRLNLGRATARDLLVLAASLERADEVRAVMEDARSLLLQVLKENIFDLPDVRRLVKDSIVDEPPTNLREGGTLRDGVDQRLDELRRVSRSAKQTIAEFEDGQRTRTGIGNLRVKYNNVFGYFIEISKGNLPRVPEDYERRQTLTNAERFTTPELKEWETKILGAEEKIIEIESEIFEQIVVAVRRETQNIQATARALATLDALASFAEAAARRGYVRPILHDGDEIEIRGGRHPVVETVLEPGAFVPNDLYLNNSTDRLLVITGANMGGKSTLLRQTALIQILAQAGSFVPATSARLPMIDRIWTRVGASDDLATGRSTFMVEMTETAAILQNATPRSLVILDELGRGTSTFDGLSIAWAVAEYLHNSPEHSAKTLFATHYHEMTELAETLGGGKNYQMAATEKDGKVVFLHRLQPGKASKSYGISVARLAGLPWSVIERAREVLARLERYELAVFGGDPKTGVAAAAARSAASQMALFPTADDPIEHLRNVDVDSLSPGESVEVLRELKKALTRC
jgi:DNA mismatch repair protein MutS